MSFDREKRELVLHLVEDSPWPRAGELEARLRAIQARIFAAVDAALDGELSSEFPEHAGLAVRIQIDSPRGRPQQVRDLIAAASDFLERDADYKTALANSAHVSDVRIVAGADAFSA